jgi:iron complex transport system ATP-binding protein
MRIELQGVCVRYGARHAVRDVSLAAAPGEVLAVLGANGSGKSSLLKALAGIVGHSGALRWDGEAAAPPGAVGYMPQDNAARAALTAFEVVLLGRMRSLTLRVAGTDLHAASAALHELGIAHLAAQRIGELSGGQRQLIFLAQVLAGDPRVLLLDEPTSALDIADQLQVLGLLAAATRRRGLTTVVVLHDLNAAARFADRVALLCGGVLAACGTPAEVLTEPTLCHAFGVEVAIAAGPDGKPIVVPLRAVPDRAAARGAAGGMT